MLKAFPCGEWRCLHDSVAKFCGSEVRQAKDFSISLSQEAYGASLQTASVQNIPHNPDRKLDAREISILRGLLGSL